MSQMNVEHEQTHGQENSYEGSQWVELGGFNPSPPQPPEQDYNRFNYIQQASGASSNAQFNQMNPPAPSSHQQLRPLVVPPWPSMLTSQSTFAPTSLPTAPAPAAMPTSTTTQSTTQSSPRRTLTDADRRRMCVYHEENPTVKQTEIGAMFGVERSTVSKVLRQKEKYMYPEDGSRSPIKRSKGRFPDIERALSNWARNTQKSGMPVTDTMIKEKARFFATTVGNSDSHIKINNTSWLEKFKQKNHIGGLKSRRNSETHDSESGLTADPSSSSHTPSGISPTSPHGLPSPSPMSSTKSQESGKTESPDSYLDFSQGFRLSSSQSATSLSSMFTETTPSSFSAGATSPTSPFFGADPAAGSGSFLPSQQARLPPLSAANNPYNRPRSQTFPLVTLDPNYSMSTPPSSEPLTPKYLTHGAFDSPLSEMPPPSLSIDATISPPPPPHHSPSGAGLPQPPTPSQDEARRALEVVMAFFQRQPSGVVEPHEYMTIGKLMEKLRLQGGAPAPAPPPPQPPPSGLQRIQEEREGSTKGGE